MDTELTDLSGHLLIAMPGMEDPRFAKSVVLICAHGGDGAMGLILNKPASDLRLGALFEQLSIESEGPAEEAIVYFGGPVEGGRGFVLHSPDYRDDDTTLDIGHGFGMTATLGILRAMSKGQGPERSLVALGYAGWEAGQLEDEIAENGWLVCDASDDLVFGSADGKWLAALGAMGINPLTLSADGGRA